MKTYTQYLFRLWLILALPLQAQHLLIPMDFVQTDHLKAYGVAFVSLTRG